MVRPVKHTVTCETQPAGEWPYKCQVSGIIENAGTGKATRVLVRVEFGKELRGMRSFTFNPLGDLNAGMAVDFMNEFTHYEDPISYDIWVQCASYDVSAMVSTNTRTPTLTPTFHTSPAVSRPSPTEPVNPLETAEPFPAATVPPAPQPAAALPTIDRCLALHTIGLPECAPPTQGPTGAPLPNESISWWKDYPIMPAATGVQMTEDESTFSYIISAPPLGVEEFYKREMSLLGWKLLTAGEVEKHQSVLIFQRDSQSIKVIITGEGDETRVVLSDR